MTREEAISILSQVNHILVTSNSWVENTHELLNIAFDMAIKALEQEPFINKPCVSEKVCKHDKQKALDKLRAEIAEYGSIWVQYEITGRRDKDIEQLVRGVLSQAKEQVLEVIDKYRAESEV